MLQELFLQSILNTTLYYLTGLRVCLEMHFEIRKHPVGFETVGAMGSRGRRILSHERRLLWAGHRQDLCEGRSFVYIRRVGLRCADELFVGCVQDWPCACCLAHCALLNSFCSQNGVAILTRSLASCSGRRKHSRQNCYQIQFA